MFDLKLLLTIAVLAAVLFLAVLYGFGLYLSKDCSSIGPCSQCWNVFNSTDKNNAYVNLTLCACARAENMGYSDIRMNEQIVGRYKLIYNLSDPTPVSVQDICKGNLPLSYIEEE